MKRFVQPVLFLFCIALLSGACKKTISYPSAKLTDYMPMAIGKYVTYRLDSMLFINVGSQDTIVSYLAKDVVDDSITDNTGRPSWRVIRYLTDTAGIAPFTESMAYMVTITGTDVEVVENNLRYIKLVLPFTDNISWLGNAYIDTKSADSQVPYMDGWNYTYSNTDQSYTALQGTVPESVTVNQVDETTGVGANNYSERDFSEEVYGKTIGLIYKNTVHTVYQPPNASCPAGCSIGYGITLNMVDHN